MPSFVDLREFISELEKRGDLVRITTEVDPNLEMTEIADRTLRGGGPALLFENPKGSDIPVLANLFGAERRVALGMGEEDVEALRDVGELLAYLRQPDPPKGFRDLVDKAPLLKKILTMGPNVVKKPPCQQQVINGDDVDLTQLPIQTCWPGDVGPLVTWPLVITRGPEKERMNLGIYRMQLLGRNKLIMRWLSHRGGALDFRDWQLKRPGEPYPVAVALGADPATTLGAVTPVPDALSVRLCGTVTRQENRSGAMRHRRLSQKRPDGACTQRDYSRGLHRPRRDGGRRTLRRSHRILQ